MQHELESTIWEAKDSQNNAHIQHTQAMVVRTLIAVCSA